jgi:hypothetical protein
MGAQPYSLELPESRRSWLIPMAGLALAIVAAGAVAGINTLRKDGIEAVRPAAEFSAYQGAVTGTGPALESVAGQSLAAYEGAVTGTGPALIEMAREARSGFTGGLVTGTGPGLIEIAGDQFAEYRGSPVTGTGPALGSMAR